jgi:hypothetical protein
MTVSEMQAFSFSHLEPDPHLDSRSAMVFDVPGRITNLYGRAEIPQLYRVSLSIVALVEFTLVVDGSKIYLRLLWSQYIVNIFGLKR